MRQSDRAALDPRDRETAVVLASLPKMTPQRLRSLLNGRLPTEAAKQLLTWRASRASSSRSPALDALFASTTRAGERCLGETWQRAFDAVASRAADARSSSSGLPDIEVCVLGDSRYPRRLAADPAAPAVLFTMGDLDVLELRRVGVIGTRHATAHGRACARALGEALSSHGVAVVSGLARGIDVSAHRGVLDWLNSGARDRNMRSGAPIGVVASGLDVVYPPEHDDVWGEVARTGLLMSESPPGTEPHAYRFPLRNRIIASLCDVLVVVESRSKGGSMITVREALERGVTVMAVPGSTSTRSSEGTNLLIRDGASIALEPEDVLAVLGIEQCRRSPDFDPRPIPSEDDAELLELIGSRPMTFENVMAASTRDLADVALALGRLEARGWLICTAGWFERVSAYRS